MILLKRSGVVAAIIVLLAAAGWFGYHAGSTNKGGDSSAKEVASSDAGPIATVETTPLLRKQIEETLSAYGTVIVAPGQSQTFSVPFECRVKKVIVTEGQRVDPKTALLIVEPSPDTQLQYSEAVNQLNTAREQLKMTQNLINLQLATKQDLATLEAEVHSLELKVKSFKDRGIDGDRTLHASEEGLVSVVHVQQGEIVPAGNVLLETAGANDIQAQLGVESEDIVHVHEDQKLMLHQVNMPGDSAIEAIITRVTHRVNPETRLIDVYVRPLQPGKLLLHDYVWGEIVVSSVNGLVVPRPAVLPKEEGHILFTVENGTARAHDVQIGLENKNEYEVISNDLKAGQQVVVVGNLELEDGMRINVESVK